MAWPGWIAKVGSLLSHLVWPVRIAAGISALGLLFLGGWYVSSEMRWAQYPPTDREGYRVQPKPRDFDKWSCADRLRWAGDELAEYGLSPSDFVTAAASVSTVSGPEVPPRLLAAVILNELSDYGLEDELQEWVQVGDGSSGIAQLQPSRVLDHELLHIPEQRILEKWYSIGTNPPTYVDPQYLSFESVRGEITAADHHRWEVRRHIAWQALSDPRFSLRLAAAEIRYLLRKLEAGGSFADLYFDGRLDPRDLLRHARENPNPRYAAGTSREASLTHAVVAAYNTSSIIRDWSQNRDRSCYGMNARKHAYRNACIHADNALRIWLHCLIEADWPEDSASPNDAPTFFGAGSHGRRFAYVVDRSSSMHEDDRMRRALDELSRSVRSLPGDVEYRVIFFSSSLATPPGLDGWVPSGSATSRSVEQWFSGVEPSGGTQPRGAFSQLLRADVRPDVIFFLTDGEIPQGVDADVRRWNRIAHPPAVIHTIAFGRDGAQNQLRSIAEDSRGDYVIAN